MKHESNFCWFDFLRGVSAIIVLTAHVRALIFVTFPSSTADIDLIGRAFYFLTRFSHQAVIVFFVLSGFFIIKTIHSAILRNDWSVKTYAINRMSRLWIVLLPALILTLLLDKIGLNYFIGVLPYAGDMKNIPGIYPVNQLGLSYFFGNLFFLQTIFTHTYGTNVALWSLANEFWYYLIFPLLYFSSLNYYRPLVRVIIFSLAITLSFIVGKGIMMYFPIWLMGGLTYLLIKHGDISFLKNKFIFLSLIGLFFSGLICIRFNYFHLVFNDYTLALILSLLLYNLSFKKMNNVILNKTVAYLSNVSYSVYLTHISFASLAVVFFFKNKIEWSYLGFLYYLLMCIIVF
jgi:peptidoglycan/LPS O-acetylase OafA/YrhL